MDPTFRCSACGKNRKTLYLSAGSQYASQYIPSAGMSHVCTFCMGQTPREIETERSDASSHPLYCECCNRCVSLNTNEGRYDEKQRCWLVKTCIECLGTNPLAKNKHTLYCGTCFKIAAYDSTGGTQDPHGHWFTDQCTDCLHSAQSKTTKKTASPSIAAAPVASPEKEPMPAPTSPTTTAFNSTWDMALEAGTSGAKAGAAAELVSFMVDGLKDTFHENLYVQAALGNHIGNWVARLLLPILFYFAVCWAPSLTGPVDAEKVKKVCYYAHQGNVTLVMGPILHRITPLLKTIAAKAAGLDSITPE